MKHIRQITKQGPKLADVWQDVLCTIASSVVGLLEIKGGGIPLLSWVDEKCQPSTILES